MPAQILDGKAIAAQIEQEIKAELEELKSKYGVTPGLAVVLVGENPASEVYVRNKGKKCSDLGINSIVRRLPESASEQEIIDAVQQLNEDTSVHGIIVQLPLPKHVDPEVVISHIDPSKDVDGFHPVNVGWMFIGRNRFVPCTPAGIIEILDRSKIEIEGKRAVVIGRSNIVGKPLSILLLQRNATVTVCHSRTVDLPSITRQADILIAAVGRARFVTADMVKEGAVVIDVGINRVDDKIVGDVDFDAVKEVASAITPVPGGVGPLTVIMLMRNTVQATKMRLQRSQ
ncbi:MAG: bifunctional methylenetetrahydrofolate dehydrogenase/methenyltetrahydrofolate cyclohydrolase FolD [Armatimonadota bacterium]|nr:bifunctional methylenetetrahydrofolate dehydrogenase/methenyltetrahydrofolate cyclohydrolase FolD [Armatimonadota bacterium]MDW8024684.1 bifunctional methylenetetrahydrofolate dehydrogenase/methenyltetrahydrofolate cyclohydrolase FolD [Armatimonadota bacterium]